MAPRPVLGSFARFAGLFATALLASCGGGSGLSGPTTGALQVRMVDTPVDDAQHVYVTIDSVVVFRIDATGQEIKETLVDTPAQYDLLVLRNGVEAILGGGQFPPGEYKWVKLNIPPDSKDDIRNLPADQLKNYIVIEGTAYPLIVPHGEHPGIKIKTHFTITPGSTTVLSLDFDVRASVTRCGHKHRYHLRPKMRLIETEASGGSISGAVTTSDGTAVPANAVVSAQQGGAEVATATIDANSLTYSFTGLAVGSYDLVVIAPEYAFASETGVSVVGGQDASGHNFTISPTGSGAVTGVVTPATDSVTVRLVWNGFTVAKTSTDPSTGEYLFDVVPEGSYTVVATDGTSTASADVTVTAGNATTQDFAF